MVNIGLNLKDEEVVLLRNGKRVRSLPKKWAELYGLLEYARREGRPTVDVDRLSEMESWSETPQSIGKAMARHLAELRQDQLVLIASPAVTKQWQLTDIEVHVEPEPLNLGWWLSEKGLGRPPEQVRVDWIQHITRGLIAFQCGQFHEARTHAAAAFAVVGLDITRGRVAALLLCRIAASSGKLEEEVIDLEDVLLERSHGQLTNAAAAWGIPPLGAYFRGRIAAMRIIGTEAKTRESHREQERILNKRLEDAQAGADLATQAILHNAWGVLATRQENYDAANYHLHKAINTASAIADLFTLGGAVVNLAISIMRAADETDLSAATLAIELVNLSIELDRRLSFGRNSAQAQILAARISTFQGNLDAAVNAINDAKTIVHQTGNSYDEGCLWEAEAKYVWATAMHGVMTEDRARPIVENLLLHSAGAFQRSGRSAADRVRKQLAHFRSGGQLSLSPLG